MLDVREIVANEFDIFLEVILIEEATNHIIESADIGNVVAFWSPGREIELL